jgi:hypothetical protein
MNYRAFIGVCAACTLASTVLAGCSRTCTQSAVVGNYTIRSGADTYDLRLANDGTAILSRDGRSIAHLPWDWYGEQIFLHVDSGEVFDQLETLADPDHVMARAGIAARTHGAKVNVAFGLTPECWFGSVKALRIGAEAPAPAFSRTN